MAMKKFIIIIILILLNGCAAKQELITSPTPQTVGNRPAVAMYQKTRDCLKLSDDGITTDIRFVQTKQLGAYIDSENTIYFTVGLFKYDDITVTFIIAHELSHAKLNHIRNRNIASVATTGIMTVAGFIIPGLGYLNYAVNPAITRNFGKSQELDADRLASETLVKCFGISVDQQIPSLITWLYDGPDGGGFWSTHPSADDRIASIKKLR
ncbi:MAG: M48 family metalloprotease [Syntrophales bacterium]